MGEDLGSLHAFRYADKVARYVSAWYGVSPPLSVPLGTAWISASFSCVPNGTPLVLRNASATLYFLCVIVFKLPILLRHHRLAADFMTRIGETLSINNLGNDIQLGTK